MILMTLLTLLTVLAVEYYLRWGEEYRHFNWLTTWSKKLSQYFSGKVFFHGWGGVVLLLVLPVLSLLIAVNLFSGIFYLLISFLVSCIILFFSLGPKPLINTLRSYLDASEKGDFQAASIALSTEFCQQTVNSTSLKSDEATIRQATDIILSETQTRYFSVIFWFVALGPLGALFYRLANEYLILCIHTKPINEQSEEQDDSEYELALKEHAEKMKEVVFWLEWLPVRVSAFIFLLVGDFVKSFPTFKTHLTDFDCDNQQVVIQVGKASIGLTDDEAKLTENQEVVALIKRSFIIYLVFISILTLTAL